MVAYERIRKCRKIIICVHTKVTLVMEAEVAIKKIQKSNGLFVYIPKELADLFNWNGGDRVRLLKDEARRRLILEDITTHKYGIRLPPIVRRGRE